VDLKLKFTFIKITFKVIAVVEAFRASVGHQADAKMAG
jgi:hypothetical protein